MSGPPTPAESTVSLPGLTNLRDVGGLETRDGRRVRRGALLRSATPYFIDAAAADALVDQLGLRLRIDLRSNTEVAEATNSHLAAVEPASAHLPFRAGVAWTARGRRTDAADAIAAHYLRYLDRSSASMTGVVRRLLDPANHAVLLHCTAGKDRTGVAVAVVLDALGVPAERIVADYGLTAIHLEALWVQLRTLSAYDEWLAVLPEEALVAEPAAMTRFLLRLHAEHGGAVGYLADHGVDGAELTALRAALLEDAP